MRKIAVAAVAAALLLAGCGTAGAPHAVVKTRTVTRRVTVTRTITRWRTRDVTVGVPSGGGVRCCYGPQIGVDVTCDGTGAGAPPNAEGTCTMSADAPTYLGDVTFTAPDGQTVTYGPVGNG
jgi:hypothetical protein